MTQLLVSVRNATEAEAALRGGAGLIDVKEPANGPLGKADDDVIEEVVRTVAGRVPVSAALGDWMPPGLSPHRPLAGLDYVKFGLANLDHDNWRMTVTYNARHLRHLYGDSTPVVAAYADWRQAQAPSIEDVCAHVREHAGGVFLLDTFSKKEGQSLLNWVSLSELVLPCKLCRDAGVRIALAGSLGPREIRELLFLQPDWIAVRGAACDGGRGGVISEDRVRELVCLINSPTDES
jgi:(5-formylfuran-3-yl)methyl phosphate synthase